jgi:DNA polymerase III alpha subunit
LPDIDIDFANREKALGVFKHITASRDVKGELVSHNTGVYLHKVPTYAPSNLCSVEHKQAEDMGWFKLDFLNVGIYTDVIDEAHLNTLIEREPIWDLLTEPEFSDKLFHVAGHSTLLKTMKPQSIPQLAACLAMIRPAKRHLVGQPWDTVMKEVWKKPEGDEYFFKKSHATAYAVGVIVHMNLLCEKFTSSSEIESA